MNETAEDAPADLVIFGGTGDLALRKLLPALLLRMRDGQLSWDSRIIAVSRAGLDSAGYRDKVLGELHRFVPEKELATSDAVRFASRLEHVSLDVNEDADWSHLREQLTDTDRIRVFYLACAPGLFGPIATHLRSHDLITPQSRVVLEKPIGRDLASAEAINNAVGEVFAENQIFRIDHYLGKESVQNLLVMRFANRLFEPLWNSTAIDHVQITVAESVGVGTRGEYYDTSGALRDMVQNHLLQLLCLVAMEPPNHYDRDAVRDEKLKVLKALRSITPADAPHVAVPGQYIAGRVEGADVAAYTNECGNPGSRTETFVALKVEVANWRWAGVPFYLRTGKCMGERRSEIVIQFKQVPHALFDGSEDAEPNRLVIRLQPEEGMRLEFIAKEPGPGGIRLRPVSLQLDYAHAFSNRFPEAYERLLMDVVRGNPTLFMRRDEVEAAWTWTEPILSAWATSGRRPGTYAAGTDGPAAATSLIERDGRSWYQNGATR